MKSSFKRTVSAMLALLFTLSLFAVSPPVRAAVDDGDGVTGGPAATGSWVSHEITPAVGAAADGGKAVFEFDVVPTVGANAKGMIVLTNASQGATSSFGYFHIILRVGDSAAVIDACNGAGNAALGSATNWSGAAGTGTEAMPYTVGSKYHVKIEADVTAKKYDAYVTDVSAGVTKQIANQFGFRTSNDISGGIAKLYLGSGGSVAVGGYTVSNFTAATVAPSGVILNPIADIPKLAIGAQQFVDVTTVPFGANIAVAVGDGAVASAVYDPVTCKLTVTGLSAGTTGITLTATASGYTAASETFQVTVAEPSEPTGMALHFVSTGSAAGKLWIDGIGETVFDAITYSKVSTGGRADRVTLDPGTGQFMVEEGYTLATTGKPAQAVTFRVDANYYNSGDVLFAENFEDAVEGDRGVEHGGGQKFSGTYGANATPAEIRNTIYEMPIVIDPAKARAGSKSVTQGKVNGQAATVSQAENIKAPLDGAAKAYLADHDGVATMWYYDDGSSLTGSSQMGFGGGVYPNGWTAGTFSNFLGLYYQSGIASGGYSQYSLRHGGTFNGTSFTAGGTWTSGPARTKGWHKLQWKLGSAGTTFWVDGVQIGTINSTTVRRDTAGGLFLSFNWNNISVPFNTQHFIDSFFVLKGDATASESFSDTVTVYVVGENDNLSLTFTKTDDKHGALVLGNVDGIGAVIDTKVFSTAADIAGKLTLNPDTGAVTALSGYLLSDASNPLAVPVLFEADVTFHYDGGEPGDETFHSTVTVYYDIDESQTPLLPLTGTGAREVIDLNAGWRFGGKNAADASAPGYDDADWRTVNVPHDWNAVSGSGGGSHDDGTYWYRKTLTLTAQEAADYNARSAYLEFDAVGMEAHVFLNGEEVGLHRGGWTAFKIDVTGKLIEGDNLIAVSANNERKLNGDISPLWGDFNNASGINRDVRLVLTSQMHLDQLDHGSHGVYLIPRRTAAWDGAADKTWEVDVTARIANDTARSRAVTVVATVTHPTSFDDVLGLSAKGLLLFDPADMYAASAEVVGTAAKTITAGRGVATEAKFAVNVNDPKLWDGVTAPYQYVARIDVYEGEDTTGALLDSYETMIGFRYYDAVRTDNGVVANYGKAGDGFYLNGRLYPLRGMAMHKDWPGLGRALENKYIEKDIEVLYEMGATWTRVSHYPHDEYTYQLLAQYGIACSAEIPLVDGVAMVNRDGSYTTSKTVGILSPGFKQTTLDQLADMVKQNYNTASILGWLLQNELGGGTYGQGAGNADVKPAQSEMITALNDLAHQLDPGRKTVMAMSLSHCYEYDSDWLLWNGYPGWYDSSRTGIGYFVDGNARSNVENRLRPTGVSEYGAGVNPYHHAEYIRGVTSFTSWYSTGAAFHPESYGNDRHEVSLREINARPFYWATAGWIMFDFAAASRNEGGRSGINDKGLVRKERPADVANYSGDPEELLLRKDGFYLYKANWHPQPMTYIAERRYDPRPKAEIIVTVYSNAPVVELWQDGVLIGTKAATPTVAYVDRNTIDEETGSCIFKFNVVLTEGGNVFEAKGFEADGETPHSDDTVIWQYGNPAELDIQSDVFAVNNGAGTIMLTFAGSAEDIADLVAPLLAVTHNYRVLTADQRPVTSGPITAGMLLEVTWGAAKRLYTFQQPYISALKPVLLDGETDAAAALAVDFKEDTCWEAEDTAAHTLTVDLGKRYVLTELKVNWANEGAASKYTVETSHDGILWNTVADRSGNTVAAGIVQNELQSYGRYVRLSIAAGSIPSISELEIYGWMVSLAAGERRIYVDETERTICVPIDIPDFHTGGQITAGMDFTNIAPLLVFEGNGRAAHVNYDYSLDLNTSRYVVTDMLGREIPFVFQGFTGTEKPAGPFELAMGKPATCSSVQSSAYPAINATTEDDTRWNAYSQGRNGLNEWVMVDLGTVCLLDSIRLEFPRNGVGGIGSNRYYLYEVFIGDSADGPFEKIIDGLDNTDMNGIFNFSAEVAGRTARFVRVKVSGNSSGYQPGLNRLYVKGWRADSAEKGPVRASIRTESGGDLDARLEYILSLENMERVMNVRVRFELDGNMLAGNELEMLQANFEAMTGDSGILRWTPKGDDIWEGEFLLMYLGSPDGLTAEAAMDVAKLIFTAKQYGAATVTLTGLLVTGLDEDGFGVTMDSEIAQAEATAIVAKVYSKYDLNKDGVIDQRDLAMVQRYYMAEEGDANWAAAQVCDFDGDGKITMLDLVDLFVNFTK